MATLSASAAVYPAKAHAARIAKTLGAKSGLILLAGRPSLMYDDSDMPVIYRQRRYFFYLTGVEDADCYATYDISRSHLTLWVPDQRTQREILYMGPVITPEKATKTYDIDEAQYAHDLDEFLIGWLKAKKSVFLLHSHLDEVPNRARNEIAWGMVEGPGSVDVDRLLPAMNACRAIKDKWEIAAIRKANEITATAHVQVLKHIRAIDSEAAVEGIFVGTCRAGGAKNQAYLPICAAGTNAATLHYVKNDEAIKGEIFLMDAGCEWSNYACDVTRTFPISLKDGGWPSEESKNIYSLVKEMQDTCIANMKPGVLFRDLNVLAHHIMVRGLLKLGIYHNGTVKEIIQNGTSAAFLPHGIGHHLGLEVHDVEHPDIPITSGDSAARRMRPFGLLKRIEGRGRTTFADNFIAIYGMEADEFDLVYGRLIHNTTQHGKLCTSTVGLQENMVVTMEPGIYFNKFGLDEIYLPNPEHSKYINTKVLDRYRPVGGVRIEDDILITAKYNENLTMTPKGDEALKIINDGPRSQWELPKQASINDIVDPFSALATLLGTMF
ncbi:hypothetical protein BT63DRAFT_114701 [Microthyrium microscopicum]|uniref:Xaa-Pro aminopeptidase n=1 Tax=Microthyrium microscopicum TaxID=703497 RepID=A0A6A6TVT8_9PEZI|nr:hypothetical protein BT63DRAFT_114701 [Microthyrium microscopicum]